MSPSKILKPRQVTLAEALKEDLPVHPSQDFEKLPDHMCDLLLTERNGFWWITPWFVDTDVPRGIIDFRVVDQRKWRKAVLDKRCWVCGGLLGVHFIFVLGPMCIISRTSGEPPSHGDCALWSVSNCPFMANPEMVRRPAPLPEGSKEPAGIGLTRNPGVAALWPARDFEVFRPSTGGNLIRVGDPDGRVHWYKEGRAATRQDVLDSIEGGLPKLKEVATLQGPEAMVALLQQYQAALQFLPAA